MGVIIGLYVTPTPPPPSILPPTVTTNALPTFGAEFANGGGNVTSDGGATVTARGVCWSTSPNPTTADFTTSNGTGTGTFTSNLTQLTANTTYYVRAYATNIAGTGYGTQQTITTDVYRVIKVNSGDPTVGGVWLGNSTLENQHLDYCINTCQANWIQLYGLYSVFGNSTKEGYLRTFISKSYARGIERVGAIMGNGISGFQSALSYNNNPLTAPYQQFNDFNKEAEFWLKERIYFTVNSSAPAGLYSITLGNNTYSYTAGSGMTPNAIAYQLEQVIPSTYSPYTASVNSTYDTVVVNASSMFVSFSFSYTSNLSPDLIRESFDNITNNITGREYGWSSSMAWLRNELDTTYATKDWITSAYVQNYPSGWGYNWGKTMAQVLDVYEATEYTLGPADAGDIAIVGGSSGHNNYPQIDYIASGAFELGVTRSFVPIFSAETGGTTNFMGNYFISVGLSGAETAWASSYAPLNISRKANAKHVGYNYFSYNELYVRGISY